METKNTDKKDSNLQIILQRKYLILLFVIVCGGGFAKTYKMTPEKKDTTTVVNNVKESKKDETVAKKVKVDKEHDTQNASETQVVKVKQPKIADTDGDGVEDSKDKCPDIVGLKKYNGCEEPRIPKGFVKIPGGYFMMGSHKSPEYLVETYKKYNKDLKADWFKDERPVHRVYIDGFYMSKYEVTNAQYSRFLNDKGNQEEGKVNWLNVKFEDCMIEQRQGKFVAKSGYANHPVICLSWYGARAYCRWRGGRLPTEAEWEYAARGGTETKFYWGDDETVIYKYANFADNNLDKSGSVKTQNDGYKRTSPVGSFLPNKNGLHDMAGNVWEWCSDWYGEEYYEKSPAKNPKGPSSGRYRVLRGGSWHLNPWSLRSANRDGSPQRNNYGFRGFRVVLFSAGN